MHHSLLLYPFFRSPWLFSGTPQPWFPTVHQKTFPIGTGASGIQYVMRRTTEWA